MFLCQVLEIIEHCRDFVLHVLYKVLAIGAEKFWYFVFQCGVLTTRHCRDLVLPC